MSRRAQAGSRFVATKLHGDGADHGVEAAGALVLADAVVALLASGGAPGVLDLPVVLARVGADADDEDAVVEALGVAEDLPRARNATGVELHGAGVDADGER